MQGVERFAQFEILKTLGSGRLATVYLAIDHAHDREVALKIFDPTSVPQLTREAAEQRFTDETRAAMAATQTSCRCTTLVTMARCRT